METSFLRIVGWTFKSVSRISSKDLLNQGVISLAWDFLLGIGRSGLKEPLKIAVGLGSLYLIPLFFLMSFNVVASTSSSFSNLRSAFCSSSSVLNSPNS